MGFFKEVDLEINEKAPDEKTAQEWKHLANEHFEGKLLLSGLPAEVQSIIKGVEEVFVSACENINAEHNEEVGYVKQ